MDTSVQAVQIPGLSVADVLIQDKWLVLGQDTTVSIPEFTQFESGKSMMRYLPPKGTAGFASFWVSA